MSTSLAPPPAAPPPAAPPATAQPALPRRNIPVAGRGEPFVWLTGSGLAFATLMIVALLLLVVVNGARTFWPRPLVELRLRDGTTVLGEVTRTERYRPAAAELEGLPAATRDAIAADGGSSTRRLVRTGNYDLYGDDFKWVQESQVLGESRPADAWMFERLEWGAAIGRPAALLLDGKPVAADPASVTGRFAPLHAEALARLGRIRQLEKHDVGAINYQIERARLAVRKAAIEHGEASPEHRRAADEAAAAESALHGRYLALQAEIDSIRSENARYRIEVRDAVGQIIPERPGTPDAPLLLSQVVRAYPANALSLGDKIGIYIGRWREFLSDEPREANTEGGVFPAIFGTFLMTVIMSLAVAPFGVVAALYLREYARQGMIVSAVRIAVNNLAGVPSIVFGVFGLGFFCYVLGGSIDHWLYPEKLPSPTFGTGGILWAALTLALLTVPVVIVATEEAIAAVPRSMREGSFACGASKWQTIRRIVLPSATPGILTGLILAMARGAGEVAPLMITGVVKLAPELPFDEHFPYIHLERSFMHLGFHIYDVGFQSRNSEAGKPMVFTTTLLLIALVTVLNITAIRLRSRLKQRYRSGQF